MTVGPAGARSRRKAPAGTLFTARTATVHAPAVAPGPAAF